MNKAEGAKLSARYYTIAKKTMIIAFPYQMHVQRFFGFPLGFFFPLGNGSA